MTKLTDMIEARRARQANNAPSLPNPINQLEATTDVARVEDTILSEESSDANARIIPVTSIEVRKQARKTFRHIDSLAADILARGQLQAIVVRELSEGRYVLVSGERRLRAIRDELKRATIAVRLVNSADDEQSLRMTQLAENLQRDDYEPLEIARELATLKETFNYTNVTLADDLRVSRAWVWRQLTLLEAPAHIQHSIENGSLAATEYLNNKSLYLNPTAADANDATASNTAIHSLARQQTKPVSRIPRIALPMKTAHALVEILELLSQRHELSPIALGKKPTRDELLAVLTTRAHEIWQQLSTNTPTDRVVE